MINFIKQSAQHSVLYIIHYVDGWLWFLVHKS